MTILTNILLAIIAALIAVKIFWPEKLEKKIEPFDEERFKKEGNYKLPKLKNPPPPPMKPKK